MTESPALASAGDRSDNNFADHADGRTLINWSHCVWHGLTCKDSPANGLFFVWLGRELCFFCLWLHDMRMPFCDAMSIILTRPHSKLTSFCAKFPFTGLVVSHKWTPITGLYFFAVFVQSTGKTFNMVCTVSMKAVESIRIQVKIQDVCQQHWSTMLS